MFASMAYDKKDCAVYIHSYGGSVRSITYVTYSSYSVQCRNVHVVMVYWAQFGNLNTKKVVISLGGILHGIQWNLYSMDHALFGPTDFDEILLL